MNTSEKTYLATAGLTKEAAMGRFAFNTLKAIPRAFKGKGVGEAASAVGRQMRDAPGDLFKYFGASRNASRSARISRDLAKQKGLLAKAGPAGDPDVLKGIGAKINTLGEKSRRLRNKAFPNGGGLQSHYDDAASLARQGVRNNRFGALAYGGLAAGGAAGVGNKALNVAGQMTAPGSDSYQKATNNAWGQAASASRLGMLFNPQGEYQRIAQSLQSSAPQKSWTRHIPGFGFSAGRQDAKRNMYQQMAQGMQGMQLPLSYRLAYALNPENFITKMRNHYLQQGAPV